MLTIFFSIKFKLILSWIKKVIDLSWLIIINYSIVLNYNKNKSSRSITLLLINFQTRIQIPTLITQTLETLLEQVALVGFGPTQL